MYRAEILADSLHPSSSRLQTFLIEFPRCVIAEVVTHRRNYDLWGGEFAVYERTTTPDISKNSASSRAIPVARMIRKVMDDPYVPDRFGAAGKGMQSHGWLTMSNHDMVGAQWLKARDNAVTRAVLMLSEGDRDDLYLTLRKAGAEEAAELVAEQVHTPSPSVSVHKEFVNRLLEPWAWVTQVVTSAHWDNFFALRCHETCHPAFRRVARMMYLARLKSEPAALDYGEWHLPFGPQKPTNEDNMGFFWEAPAAPYATHEEAKAGVPVELWRSVARCAWTSYENSDKVATDEVVMSTVDRLIGSRPVHASPAEHQAMCAKVELGDPSQAMPSNFGDGWLQLRKLLPQERCDRYEPTAEEVAAWPEAQDA